VDSLRILIADPHPIMHAAIRAQIEQALPSRIEVGPHIANGNDALRLLNEEHWDLFVTEIMLAGRDGLQVISRIRTGGRPTRSLILSALQEENYGIPALRAGAAGFVHKSSSLDVLRRAILRVARGQRFVSDALAELLAATYDGSRAEAPHDQLTGRERQVLILLSLGQRVSEIADELCVARKTIYAHRSRILKKIGAGSDQDLRRYAFVHGLVPSRRLSDMS
jgi:DNA-binding NarL/FixJ family response regulator